jgi:hypothetical protein
VQNKKSLSQVGAEVVYLTHEKGKNKVTHYHSLNEGIALLLPANDHKEKQLVN